MLKSYRNLILFFIVAVFVVLGVGCGTKNKIIENNDIAIYPRMNTERGEGYHLYGHSKYGFEIEYPVFFESGNVSSDIIGEFIFPQSMFNGTNLVGGAVYINRNFDTCDGLGYGFDITPGWQFGEKVVIGDKFKENIIIGDVEFKRKFCGGVIDDDKIFEAMVYTTYKDGEPLSLSLVLISKSYQMINTDENIKLYKPEIFEAEFLEVLKTYKYKNN